MYKMNSFEKLRGIVFFIACCLILCVNIHAQSYDPPFRIELESKTLYNSYFLDLAGEKGLILMQNNHDDLSWKLIHYDTLFQTVTAKDITFNKSLFLQTTFLSSSLYCAALQTSTKAKDQTFNSFFVSYDFASHKINVYAFKLLEDERIEKLAQTNNCIVFSTINDKSEEKNYLFDCEHSTYTNFGDNFSICSFVYDTNRQCLWIDGIESISKNDNHLRIFSISNNGKIEKDMIVYLDSNYYLHESFIQLAPNNNLLVSGLYSSKNRKSKILNSGLYNFVIQNDTPQQARFLEFSDIELLTDQQRLANCHSHTFSVYQNDSIQIVATEFYEPIYEQDNNIGFYYTNMYSGVRLVGFKYIKSFISTISTNGDFKDYNVVVYPNLLLKEVRKLISGYVDEENNLLVLFADDGKIFSLIFNKETTTLPSFCDNIEPCSRLDIVNKDYSSTCRHWYGNYFLCYGFQQLTKRGANKRSGNHNIFYFSKLIYD